METDALSASIDLIMSVLTVSGYMGILYLLFISLQNGSITVGAFAALILMMEEVLTGHLGEAMENMGKVSYLIRFFDLPEKIGDEKEIDWTGNIEVNSVSFIYPNAVKESLSHLSLKIKSGETLAIVDENGAGKSTLIKLSIIVNGKDTKEGISFSSRYNGISAVFQKLQRYQLTLKNNIEISDSNASKEMMGVETVLSREFDGVDLSGGQWQRIAIARGLYRPHNLIVLDEPTAAIDPIEECLLYEKFTELAADNTAIIVTHRLTSAQLADRIIVMKDGQIVEEGTDDRGFIYKDV